MTRPGDQIDAYLAELAASLHASRGRRARIVAEVRAHLEDAVEAERAAGHEDPAGRALARFGPVSDTARQFDEAVPRSLARRAWSDPLLRRWAIATAVVTTLALASYGIPQQHLRNGADNPQRAQSARLAESLSHGVAASAALHGPKVDLRTSLAGHTTIYSASGRILASTATLDGATPRIPAGVLRSALRDGVDRVTWQPADGVRVAAIARPYDNGAGVIVVGRSLREVEHRIDRLTRAVGLAWLTVMLLISGWTLRSLMRRRPPPGAMVRA